MTLRNLHCLLATLLYACCTGPVRADDGMAAIQKLLTADRHRISAAQTASADVLVTVPLPDGGHFVGHVECRKPNFLRMELWPVVAKGRTKMTPNIAHTVSLSDGNKLWDVDDAGMVSQKPAGANGVNLAANGLWWDYFYKAHNSDGILNEMKGCHGKITHEIWQGRAYRVGTVTGGSLGEATVRFYVGQDNLIHRVAGSTKAGRFELVMNDIRLNAPISQTRFVFNRPAFAYIPKSKVDPAAKPILEAVQSAYQRLDSLSAHAMEVTHGYIIKQKRALYNGYDDDILMMRPNYFKLDSSWVSVSKKTNKLSKARTMLEICDGTHVWNLWDFEHNYYQKDSNGSGKDGIVYFGASEIVRTFFESDPAGFTTADAEAEVKSITYLGTKQWHGDTYRLIERTFNRTAELPVLTYTYYVGADNLIHRIYDYSESPDGSTYIRDYYITDLHENPRLAAADFAFSIPPGGTEKVEFPQTPSKPLLAAGVDAPDFTVHDRNGAPVKLSDYKGKVVVLDFWATWCGPCQQSMPGTNDVARRFRKSDVVVLGVNVWDKPDAFKAWLPAHKSFDAIKFAIDPTADSKDVASLLYNVSGIPTQYVIDRHGKITWSTDGFSGSDDELVAAVANALKRE